MARISLLSFFLCLLLQLCSFKICGQQTHTNELAQRRYNDLWNLKDSLNEVTPSFSMGSYYDSKVVFWGRDFGEKQFGVAPYVMFNSAKGFYAYTVGNCWSANSEIPARIDLGVGFERILTDKIYVSLGYERWIPRYSDSYYNSLLTNNIEVDADLEYFGLDIEPSVYYMFGEDYVFQSDILLEKKYSVHTSKVTRISLKPSLLATFATRTFIPMYTEFYSDQINYKKIGLVDGEGSATLEVEMRSLQVEATAHCNVPVGARYEQLSPFYYFSLHVNYSFPLAER